LSVPSVIAAGRLAPINPYRRLDRRSGNPLPAYSARAAIHLDRTDAFGPIGPVSPSDMT
jgi:hypothetical protein